MKVALADLGTIITGNTPKKSDEKNYSSNDIYFVKPSDFVNDSITQLYDAEHFISHHAESSARVVPSGSVLVTCIGIIGKVAITKKKMAFNQQINAIIPLKNIVNEKFLAYALLNKQRILQEKANAPVVPIINKGNFSKLIIDVYGLEKQRKICDRLEHLENIIKYRREQLDLLDELVKSRFVEMFGDPVINSKEWPIYELSKYIQFLTSGSRGWSQYFTDNGEYFITIKNVKNCKVMLNDVQYVIPPHNAEAKRTRVQEGDLLISITADLGRTGVVTKEIADHGGYINQHLTCVRLDQSAVRSLYVAFYMESEAGKRQFQTKNQSAVKAGLNFQAINTLRIMVPPIELQDSFIAFVKEIHKSRLAIQKSLDETQLLFDSLMQKYFG